MSRFHTNGTDPNNGDTVTIVFGYDHIPGFKAGYFIQAFSQDEDIIRENPTEDGLLLNAGFLNGLSVAEASKVAKEWSMEPTFKLYKSKEPRPISAWLSELPEPHHIQALENYLDFMGTDAEEETTDRLDSALARAFPWEKSPQKDGYWFMLWEQIFTEYLLII